MTEPETDPPEGVLEQLQALADQGHAVAQFSLGFMYANSQGVAQDYAEAVRWYRLAVDAANSASARITRSRRR